MTPARAAPAALLAAVLAACAGPASGPQDATYIIDGAPVTLTDSQARRPAAPGSAAMEVTRVHGAPVFGDLDADGDDDAVLWLVRSAGGSGTFYFVAMARRTAGGFRGTAAQFIGDRIAPGRLVIDGGGVTVHFRARRSGEAMAATPSVARTLRLRAAATGLAAAD